MNAKHVQRPNYDAEGICVVHYPSSAPENARVPVILVHGGCQAAWCWDVYAPLLAQAGSTFMR